MDDISLKIYGIVVFTSYVFNKDVRIKLFKKSFLLANVKLDIVIKILFLTISSVDIDF